MLVYSLYGAVAAAIFRIITAPGVFVVRGWMGDMAAGVDWSGPTRDHDGVGRGVESEEVALERGRLDAVIAGLLFMAGMLRSEVSVLRWSDVLDSSDGDLVTVRPSKCQRSFTIPHPAVIENSPTPG